MQLLNRCSRVNYKYLEHVKLLVRSLSSGAISELSKVLALLLIEQGSYSYIDKISQTASKDLALYHIREALRDYHSLQNRGFSNEAAIGLAKTINFSKLEKEILEIKDLTDITQLREKTSLLAAEALAIAGRLMRKEEEQTTPKAS